MGLPRPPMPPCAWRMNSMNTAMMMRIGKLAMTLRPETLLFGHLAHDIHPGAEQGVEQLRVLDRRHPPPRSAPGCWADQPSPGPGRPPPRSPPPRPADERRIGHLGRLVGDVEGVEHRDHTTPIISQRSRFLPITVQNRPKLSPFSIPQGRERKPKAHPGGPSKRGRKGTPPGNPRPSISLVQCYVSMNEGPNPTLGEHEMPVSSTLGG